MSYGIGMKPEAALSQHAFVAVLRSRVDAIGQQQRAAKLYGVSGAYLSDVLNGRRDPGPKLVKALGYKRVVLYAREPCSCGLDALLAEIPHD